MSAAELPRQTAGSSMRDTMQSQGSLMAKAECSGKQDDGITFKRTRFHFPNRFVCSLYWGGKYSRKLEALQKRGIKNGVENLQILRKEERLRWNRIFPGIRLRYFMRRQRDRLSVRSEHRDGRNTAVNGVSFFSIRKWKQLNG